MVDAYATLAALGERREPLLVTAIEDRTGRSLETFGRQPERALDAGIVARLVDMMRGVIDGGTGSAARGEFGVKGDLAGKTARRRTTPTAGSC